MAFTSDDPSSAAAEQGSSRSGDGSGVTNHQAPHAKPFLVDQELVRLDSISVGVCDRSETTRKPGGFESEGPLLNNSYSSLIKDRRRKVPLVSIV